MKCYQCRIKSNRIFNSDLWCVYQFPECERSFVIVKKNTHAYQNPLTRSIIEGAIQDFLMKNRLNAKPKKRFNYKKPRFNRNYDRSF